MADERCRACGGTGIDPDVSPRAAAIAYQAVLLRRDSGVIEFGGTSNVCRVGVSHDVVRGPMTFFGPLTAVIAQIEFRLRNGFVIVEGDTPDAGLACHWCAGAGAARALELL